MNRRTASGWGHGNEQPCEHAIGTARRVNSTGRQGGTRRRAAAAPRRRGAREASGRGVAGARRREAAPSLCRAAAAGRRRRPVPPPPPPPPPPRSPSSLAGRVAARSHRREVASPPGRPSSSCRRCVAGAGRLPAAKVSQAGQSRCGHCGPGRWRRQAGPQSPCMCTSQNAANHTWPLVSVGREPGTLCATGCALRINKPPFTPQHSSGSTSGYLHSHGTNQALITNGAIELTTNSIAGATTSTQIEPCARHAIRGTLVQRPRFAKAAPSTATPPLRNSFTPVHIHRCQEHQRGTTTPP